MKSFPSQNIYLNAYKSSHAGNRRKLFY